MKPEAYLALEDTMISILQSSWLEKAYELRHKLQDLLEQNLIQEAYQLVSNTTLEGTLDPVAAGIKELGVSALLFGASAHTPIDETALYKSKKIPDVLDKQFELLKNSIEQKGWQVIKTNLLATIMRHEEDIRTEAYRTKKMDSEELAIALNEAVLNPVKMLYAAGANVTTSRLVSYGFLAEAVEKNITTYQVTEVLDGVTCRVCGYMHGKTFTVATEFSRLGEIMQITDPDELRTAAPWPKNSKEAIAELYSMTAEQLQAKGYGTPPYHPLCRGLTVPTGSVSETITPTPLIQQKPSDGPISTETGGNSGWTDKITRSTLTAEELTAVKQYLSGGYKIINTLLRNPASDLSLGEIVILQQEIGRLDSAIARGQVTGPFTAYRGMTSTKAMFGVTDPEKLIDKEVIEPAFLSVGSVYQAVEAAGEKGVFMEIQLGAGVKALVPSDYPDLKPNEQLEILLQRGLKIRVTSAYRKNDITYMVVTATPM